MDRVLEALNAQFRSERDLGSLKSDELFESFCGFSIIRSMFEDEFDPEEFRVGGSGDFSIDTAAVLLNGDLLIDAVDIEASAMSSRSLDVQFVIIQAKTSPSFDGKVVANLADNLTMLFGSQSMHSSASSDIKNLKKCIEIIYRDIGKLKELPRISVFYATSGRVADDTYLSMKCDAASRRLDNTNLFESVEWHLLGARELRELYQRATTAVSADFTMQKRVSLPRIPGVEQAFLGLMPASDLIKIITDPGGSIRKSVFYENVRDYQGDNPVNIEIKSTLNDLDRRERFAVLNNGVTIVAREIKTAGDDLQISDFQVVNGCQTCHVLFEEKDALADSVWVSVKLIESKDDDVVSGITAATNRQTAITDEDLEAKEQFHKELEELFKSFDEPERLYYERRSGQYTPHQGLEKTRIVTRGQLTRAYASVFLGEASKAGRFYKELRESRKRDLYREGQSTFAYYTAAAVAYRVEWLLRNKKIDRAYAPAKYQLMSAFKTFILGDVSLDISPRRAEKQCKAILDLVWDASASTGTARIIVEAIDRVIASSHTTGLIRDFLRSQRFTLALQREVLLALEKYKNA